MTASSANGLYSVRARLWRRRRPPAAPRAHARRARGWVRDAWSAGSRPKSSAVTRESASAHPITRASSPTSCSRGSVAGARAGLTEPTVEQRGEPERARADAQQDALGQALLTSRLREAPIAVRTAIAGARGAAREQHVREIRGGDSAARTRPRRARSAMLGPMLPTTRLRSGESRHDRRIRGRSPPSAATRRATSVPSASACASVTWLRAINAPMKRVPGCVGGGVSTNGIQTAVSGSERRSSPDATPTIVNTRLLSVQARPTTFGLAPKRERQSF